MSRNSDEALHLNDELIDPVIRAWAGRHTLHVYTSYKDEEVRSVDVVSSKGLRCQIWIDRPDERGNVKVHVWDYKKRSEKCEATASDLARCLEQAYATAMKWLE